jgi:putative heme-binding domain-containing protein
MRGPDLTRGRFRYASSDAGLFRVIASGITGSDMPDLYRSEKSIWQVVAFVRSLGRRSSGQPATGKPEAGEKLFFGKGGCHKCHRVKGVGGRAGPDLTDIGWKRSFEHLRLSLVEPNHQVDDRWWSVRLTLADGNVVDGIRMDEDTFYVRILDAGDHLRSFDKRGLRAIERIEASSMPGYGDQLHESEIEDLVAFMATLRGRSPSR